MCFYFNLGLAILDEELRRKAADGQVSAELFGEICYSIDQDNKMPKFLGEIGNSLQEWIDKKQLKFSEMSFILKATSHDDSIREQLEQYIV